MNEDEETTGVKYPTGSKVWTRLEPLTRNADMEAGLRAPVHDPLWLLGRQWQVGEFHGEDAGSPVDANVEVTHDAVTAVQLADDDAFPYDPMTDGPLETVIEREPLTTDDDGPGARQRAEAGQYFLRLLDFERDGDAEAVTAEDVPAELRLEPPDETLDPADERYVSLMAGRAPDGHALAESIAAGSPPSIDGVSADAVARAAETFSEWYGDLYDEPTSDTGDAWDPERFEYRFAVATGEGDERRTFEAEEYPGGRLDWYAFSASHRALDVEEAEDTARTETNINRLPTPIDFPGMPAPRWWEFEDSSLNLERLTAPPESPAQLAMLEFVLVYGNDWFHLPVETPVGSLSRVTTLEITDTFGVKTTGHGSEPATVQPVDGDWNIFMADLFGADDGPSRGLFVPPVLGDIAESDPVERVVLARDEMANLAFGIEELRESAVGTPVDSEAFREPGLAIGDVRPAAEASMEVVVLENTGTAELDATGWTVEVVASDGSALVGPADLDGLVIQPGAIVTVVMGAAPEAGDEEDGTAASQGDRYLGATESVLGHDDAEHVVVREPGDPEGRVADRARLPETDGSLLPAYRLATAVPDHWFPLKPTGPDATRAYRYQLARLLDIDALDDDVADIPEPRGRILSDSVGGADEPVYVYEEEVTRAGVELTRSYQLSRWLGGSTHLWSGRRARTGRGEGSSGLRFDLLEDGTD